MERAVLEVQSEEGHGAVKPVNQDTKKSDNSKKTKHLIFSLYGERYGIPLSSVKEVIGLSDITPVPHVPAFFKGLINLRGKIISVIDLRAKLSLPETEYEPKKTSIIITDIDGLTLGTIVDDVNEVAGFEKKQIEEVLDIQSNVSREFITGAAKTGEKRLILLLDIGKALSVEELALIRKKSTNKL